MVNQVVLVNILTQADKLEEENGYMVKDSNGLIDLIYYMD